jgi:hypothetical protein
MNHRMVAEIGAQLAAALAGVLRFLVALLAIFIAHFICVRADARIGRPTLFEACGWGGNGRKENNAPAAVYAAFLALICSEISTLYPLPRPRITDNRGTDPSRADSPVQANQPA